MREGFILPPHRGSLSCPSRALHSYFSMYLFILHTCIELPFCQILAISSLTKPIDCFPEEVKISVNSHANLGFQIKIFREHSSNPLYIMLCACNSLTTKFHMYTWKTGITPILNFRKPRLRMWSLEDNFDF